MIKINFRGIRFKLAVSFFMSLIVALFCGIFVNWFVIDVSDKDYNKDFKYFEDECNEINEEIENSKDDDEVESIINRKSNFVKIYILDNQGNVLIKNNECKEKSFDINALMNMEKYYAHTRYDIEYTDLKKFEGSRYIYFNENLNKGDSMLTIFIVTIVVFCIMFFVITRRELEYINRLNLGLMKIANGNFDYKVDVKGMDEISQIAENINHMSEKLYKSREEQKISEEKKDLFIMNISHDLRTPLTSVIGYIDLIKKACTEQDNYVQVKKYADIAYNKAERLNTLINDFFEYNKINFGMMSLNKMKIDMNEFLRQAVSEMIPVAMDKEANIKLKLPESRLESNVDPEKMSRVMENILMNAVRYSDKKSEIKVSLYEKENKAVIVVENKCSSFNKDKIEFIFDKFYKGDSSRSTKNSGAGLGLAIAKSIIEIHGGCINAEYNNKKVKLIITL